MTYELIKSNFEKGLWAGSMLRVCVKKGILTEEQYKNLIKETANKTQETLAHVGIR